MRRCRSRFQASDPDVLATLHECLHTVTRLLAPFVPFRTEYVWQHAITPGESTAEDSVHLARWPEPVLRRLGLAFGAFDFAVTPDGEWTFLEINPAGQWLWLQDKMDIQIAAGIADLLVSGRRR